MEIATRRHKGSRVVRRSQRGRLNCSNPFRELIGYVGSRNYLVSCLEPIAYLSTLFLSFFLLSSRTDRPSVLLSDELTRVPWRELARWVQRVSSLCPCSLENIHDETLFTRDCFRLIGFTFNSDFLESRRVYSLLEEECTLYFIILFMKFLSDCFQKMKTA